MAMGRARWFVLAMLSAISMSAFAQQQSAPSSPAAQQPAQKPAQQAERSPQGWQEFPMTDARRGTPYTQFVLPGKFIKKPHNPPEDGPALILNCNPQARWKFQSGMVRVGVPLKLEFVEPSQLTTGSSYNQRVFVHYGMDDGKSEKEQWTPGTDKTPAGFSKDTLKKILHAHTLIVSLEAEQTSEVSMQFALPDSKQVAQTCGLSIRK